MNKLVFETLGFSSNNVHLEVPREPVPLWAPYGGTKRDPYLWWIGTVFEHGEKPNFEYFEGFLPRDLQDAAPEKPSAEEILREYHKEFAEKGVFINDKPVRS